MSEELLPNGGRFIIFLLMYFVTFLELYFEVEGIGGEVGKT